MRAIEPFVTMIEGGGFQFEWNNTENHRYLELEFQTENIVDWLTDDGSRVNETGTTSDMYEVRRLIEWVLEV